MVCSNFDPDYLFFSNHLGLYSKNIMAVINSDKYWTRVNKLCNFDKRSTLLYAAQNKVSGYRARKKKCKTNWQFGRILIFPVRANFHFNFLNKIEHIAINRKQVGQCGALHFHRLNFSHGTKWYFIT